MLVGATVSVGACLGMAVIRAADAWRAAAAAKEKRVAFLILMTT